MTTKSEDQLLQQFNLNVERIMHSSGNDSFDKLVSDFEDLRDRFLVLVKDNETLCQYVASHAAENIFILATDFDSLPQAIKWFTLLEQQGFWSLHSEVFLSLILANALDQHGRREEAIRLLTRLLETLKHVDGSNEFQERVLADLNKYSASE